MRLRGDRQGLEQEQGQVQWQGTGSGEKGAVNRWQVAGSGEKVAGNRDAHEVTPP